MRQQIFKTLSLVVAVSSVLYNLIISVCCTDGCVCLLQSTNCLGEKSEMEHSRNSFPSPQSTQFPHFSNETFSQTHGYAQKLDYIHYLSKGNPAFAYANLLASDPQIESKYCSRRMKSVCQRVYRLGLSQYSVPKVTSSCAALMEMLGWDSAPFRTDIVLLNLLLQYEGHTGTCRYRYICY